MDKDCVGGNIGVFTAADILIPKGLSFEKWSCIACDQFTSNTEYWERCAELVGESPSTLRLIFPEAYIASRNPDDENKKIADAMRDYIHKNLFTCFKDSMVFVERVIGGKRVRRGLIGKIDLEAYDWAEGTAAPVRSTEGTIESRLPVRAAVRRDAEIELPHIVVFLNDRENKIIPSAAGGETLYDFELMQGGGHIKGSLVQPERAKEIEAKIEALNCGELKFAMGDGNHSLAAAKYHWNRIKKTAKPEELEKHPARYALVELVNIHDDAVEFAPIHRVIKPINTAKFIEGLESALCSEEKKTEITVVCGEIKKQLQTKYSGLSELVHGVDSFLQDCSLRCTAEIDYIHGQEDAEAIGRGENSAAILLPKLKKEELFISVAENGPFPKKSFSVGEAKDKRYYLECRKITAR